MQISGGEDDCREGVPPRRLRGYGDIAPQLADELGYLGFSGRDGDVSVFIDPMDRTDHPLDHGFSFAVPVFEDLDELL